MLRRSAVGTTYIIPSIPNIFESKSMGSRDFEGMLDVCTSTVMAQVRNFTEDQLQTLLRDESRLNSMVDSLSQVSALPNDKLMKLALSKSLAEYNLSSERKLNEEMAKLQLMHSSAVETKKEVAQLKEKLDAITESRSLDTVSTMLKTLAQDAEDESEKISEQFRSGSIDSDEFVKKYNDKRVTAQIRKVKAEKLAELLHQQQYQPASRIATVSSNQPGGSAGYPLLGQGYGPTGVNYRHSYYS